MTDRLTPEARSKNMASIRSRDTKPELLVRSMLHRLGYRYRLHGQKLPGRPDIVFAKRRKVIFVHGCYWHRHTCPNGQVIPKTRADFWQKKLTRNAERDSQNQLQLCEMGWHVMVVWECEIGDTKAVRQQLVEFLGDVRA